MTKRFLTQGQFYLTIIVCLTGCVPTRDNPKYLLSNGSYTLKHENQSQKVYLDVNPEIIRVFNRVNDKLDTSRYLSIILSGTENGEHGRYSFRKNSFDFDIISIPLKLRPPVRGFPAQLNTSLNGGVFIGRRSDIYRLSGKKDELGQYRSDLQHYGISLGIFTGIGSAVMNPSVTENRISTEYDGVVIPFGVNALVGFNNFTFGAAVGIDQMLSPHRTFWIYRNKPWLGLTVGLNLN